MYLSTFIFIILSKRYIGSPGGRVMGTYSPLSWAEIYENLPRYLLVNYFGTMFFLIMIYKIQKFEEKQKQKNTKSSINSEDVKEEQEDIESDESNRT